MPLEKRHKILLGGASTLIIVFMITIGVFTYALYVRTELNYQNLDRRLSDLQTETQKNINDISSSLLQTREDLSTVNSNLGNISQQFSQLKANVGEDFSGIIENVVPAVVTIRTDVAQGTGFLITDNGYLVTNAHVLSGGSYAQAITYDQKVIDAQFIGYDENLDIALLKIPGSYDSLSLGNSDNAQVGQKVVAIGNPLGLQFSVSQGIISGVDREGINGLPYYIQTDAALNPGNSGGPLIDDTGKVIGINNFKIGQGESLGFALESNYIKEAVNDISEKDLNQTLLA